MTNSQRLATVRSHLRWWLTQTIEPNASDQILSESILIVDGFYAGRTFETASHSATWFMEPDELKIRDQHRSVVAVFHGDEITSDHPAVAQDFEAEEAAEVETTTEVEAVVEVAAELPAGIQTQVPAEITLESTVPIAETESEKDDQPVSLPISAGTKLTPNKQSEVDQPAAQTENELDGDIRLPKAA